MLICFLVSMEKIKKIQHKCIQNIIILEPEMKAAKNNCVSIFAKCKKAEDASVRLINDCMNFDVQALNQTQIAEEAGSEITG